MHHGGGNKAELMPPEREHGAVLYGKTGVGKGAEEGVYHGEGLGSGGNYGVWIFFAEIRY